MPSPSRTSVRSGLAARRDRVDGLVIFARYSTAPVHEPVPIVLIHGLVISSVFLRAAAQMLGNTHRTYAPDLPGYGRSAKPARTLTIPQQGELLGRWMDDVGLRRAVVAGVSMGSQIATALAAARPELVRGLVLVSPTMDPRYRTRPRSLERWLLEAPHELAMARIAIGDYLRAGVRRALDTFAVVLADRPEARLPRLHMPALVVHGTKDHLVSREWAEEVARLLPDGRLENVEGGTHALNFSAPGVFAQLVADFAASLSETGDVAA